MSKKNPMQQLKETTSSDIAAIINVEVDGPRHRRMKVKSFCNIRDKRMRREGVRVARWDIVDMEQRGCLKSTKDIEKLLLAEVRKSLASLPWNL